MKCETILLWLLNNFLTTLQTYVDDDFFLSPQKINWQHYAVCLINYDFKTIILIALNSRQLPFWYNNLSFLNNYAHYLHIVGKLWKENNSFSIGKKNHFN